MNRDIAMERLFEEIEIDYITWAEAAGIKRVSHHWYEGGGRKYKKIISVNESGHESVWGFIVNGDSGKFKDGDILKAASWSAPATNKARGNIFDDEYTVCWTGPEYLRG